VKILGINYESKIKKKLDRQLEITWPCLMKREQQVHWNCLIISCTQMMKDSRSDEISKEGVKVRFVAVLPEGVCYKSRVSLHFRLWADRPYKSQILAVHQKKEESSDDRRS